MNIQKLEEHAMSRPGFNKYEKKRREWQNHVSEVARSKYQVTTRLFTKRPSPKDGARPPDVDYDVHPWIAKALVETKSPFMPNPDRAKYYEYLDKTLRQLSKSATPRFQRGDIICMSFRFGFYIGAMSWTSELLPMELIRVGTVSKWPTVSTYSVAWASEDTDQRLHEGEIMDPVDG